MAIVNAPPPPAPTAVETAPQTGEAAGRPKVEKIKYTVPEGGLTEYPTDFKVTTHKPLSAKDFAAGSEHLYYENLGKQLEKKAKAAFQKAATLKQFGSGAQAKAATQFMKLTDKVAELKAQLSKELGPDAVNALLASVMKTSDENKAAENAAPAAAAPSA